MSSGGHGIPDEAAKGAYDIIHNAEQQQHKRHAASKRGLTDELVQAEHETMDNAEGEDQVSNIIS